MGKFRVLISDSMSSKAKETLARSSAIEVVEQAGVTPGDLLATIGDYQGLLVRSRTKVTPEVIEKADKLKIIGRAGIGVDNIDLAAASRRGIIVENAPSGNAITTAEHAICLLASLVRSIPQATASMKDNRWDKKTLSGSELFAKQFGVVGLGNIGRIVADRARGLKMKVIGFDPFISQDAAARLGVELLSLEQLLERADFISIHTPLTNETRGLIGAPQFARMKQGAYLVNAARGGIVDEQACVDALESGKLAGAAFDVFAKEPPPENHPLVMHPKVITTPHLGASTDEAQEKVAVEVAEQLVAFAEHGEVRNSVNVVSVSAELRESLQPWLGLAKSLGTLLGQLVVRDGGAIDGVEVEVIGDAADNGLAACTNQALVGLLSSFEQGAVNDVNCRVLAEERGLSLSETKTVTSRDLSSAITLVALQGSRRRSVRGTLYHIGDRVEARIIEIDGYLVELAPKGRVLIVTNEDRPGVIGALGTLLGGKSINVGRLHVAHNENDSNALALWTVDNEVDESLLSEIRSHERVQSAVLVEL